MARYQVKVTLRAADGTIITRPVVLTAQRGADAAYRATIVAPKPGQTVIGTDTRRVSA